MKARGAAPSGATMRWPTPLLCLLMLPGGPAQATEPPEPSPGVSTDLPAELHVAPRTWHGTVFAGLTRLGETPLTTPLPAGEIPLVVFAPGLYPAERVARLQPGQAVTWQPILKPPMPPPPQRLPDRFATRPGGVGASAHFSAPLAETLARTRALAEAARDRQVLIAALGHTYDEVAGVGRRLTTQQTSRLTALVAVAGEARQAGQHVARITLTGGGAPTALGAADVLGEASPAAAELAALVNLLRWRVAGTTGATVHAVSRSWGDDMVEAAVVEQQVDVEVQGAVGAIEVQARTTDLLSLARRTDGDSPVEARNGDQIVARLETLTVTVHDGVLVALDGAADAATARDALRAALAVADLAVQFTAPGPASGAPVASAAWLDGRR